MRQFFSRLVSQHSKRWACSLCLILLALAQTLGYLPTRLVDQIDVFVYDMRMRLQAPELDRRIVIVDIDEKSLNEFGRWPWSRDLVARLASQLTGHYQARAVSFDVVFAEPDHSSGYAILESLARSHFKDNPQFAQRIHALQPQLDYDQRLALALQQQPVVLGYFLSNEAGASSKGWLPAPAFTQNDLHGGRIDIQQYTAYTANLAPLQQAARAGGFFNPTVDADGVIRRVSLMAQVGDGYYESLALATAKVALRASTVQANFFAADALNSAEFLKKYGTIASLQLNSQPRPALIPVDPFLTTLIQYRGAGGPAGGNFHYVSAADVLNGKLAVAELSNRIILIGTTAPGLKDLRSAPVGPDYPGVEIHANIIKSILDNRFKQRTDFGEVVEILQILLLGLLLTFGLSLLRPFLSILLTLGSLLALGSFNFWMYQQQHIVLPIATTLLLVIGLFVLHTLWGYLFEYRKGRAMVSLFGEYVAPELVEVMSKNPEHYSMEGESRDLSVLFADVLGFTAIAEQLEPNALREYVNLYLTAMSEQIRSNRGTLDKYIGDAVMAFWGAPVDLPDHARRAVASALLMQSTTQRLNAEFIGRDWPPLRIGIGINTGAMRVGDMGSAIRRAYTVMGNAVNLASRLESLTRIYGVGIIVGAATQSAAPEYLYRSLDRVQVKGKQIPVDIFEPLCLQSETSAALRETLGQWHQALDDYRAQQWDSAETIIRHLHTRDPACQLYPLYLASIANFRQHPPEASWCGVTVFTSK